MAEQKHSNQYIKRKERAQDIEFARRKIKAGILIGRLNRAAAGKVDLTKSQLEATKMLLDKAVPSLQAVEQTTVNQYEDSTPESRLALAQALISTFPELIAQLNLAPKPVEAGGSEVESPQVMHKEGAK